MRISILLAAAASLSAAVAELDFAVLNKFPKCAMDCAFTVVLPACNISDIQNCLCTSNSLKLNISTCVIGACDVPEQYTSLSVLQQDICEGYSSPSRQAEIRRVTIILAAFTYPIIILRFISRFVIARKTWWDDWTILVCVAFMIPMTVLPLYPATELGFGTHFYSIAPKGIPALLKIFYTVQIFYVIVQTLVKVSILLLYLRIFPNQPFRTMVKIAMVFMVFHGIAFFFVVAFQCSPVRSIWAREIKGKCVNAQALIYAGAGFSILEDFAIMLLPVYELKGLSLSLRKRIALIFMFALGSFACVTSIIRTGFVKNYGQTIDIGWECVDVILWSSIETFTASICACLMCIRPLIKKFLPGVFSSSANSPNESPKSWGNKIGPRVHNSADFSADLEMSVVDTSEELNPRPHTSRSQITVTTENRISFAAKRLSQYAGFKREFNESPTDSEYRLTEAKQ